jgi:hydrophobe/amphiphile efflux-1 (HAE1) family protein
MQWLAQVSVLRPVFASVLMLVLVVLGAAGYVTLGIDEFPNVDMPVVVVTARLPGSAPREIESDVTDRIEGAINTLSGIDSMQSRSTEGVAQVVVTFDLSKNGDVAVQEVRDKIQQILAVLPRGIDPPLVTKVDPSATPVVLLAVRGTRSLRETSEVADVVVRRRLESIAGVGQVSLVGSRRRQLRVWLDPAALRARDMTAEEVQGALAAQNLTTPGGDLESGPTGATLRVAGRVQSPAELAQIVVRDVGGNPVIVRDVARVEDGAEDARSHAELDGTPTVLLTVRKQAGTNTVEVVDALKARLDDIRAALPPGVSVDLVRDNSASIRTGIHAVTEHLVVGALLAALVVLVFLGDARSTLIAAVAIPISVIGTFGVMKLVGFTLNSLTLLALALAVGIVIDDAIVVLENVTRWIDEKHAKPFVATVLATREIGLAVLATTLSLMAVFVPVALMGGMAGKFLASFGLTMAFAIAASMLVSFTLTPAMTARMLGVTERASVLRRVVDAAYAPVERTYMAVLRWSMRHRWVIVLAMVSALGSCVPIAKRLPSGFTPSEDRAEFEVRVRTPEGTTLDETRLVTERIAQDASRLTGVEHTLLTVGEDAQETANLGNVRVILADPRARAVTQQAVMNALRRDVFPRYPSTVELRVAEIQPIAAGNSMGNVTYALTGQDLEQLARKAQHIAMALKKVPSAVDVDSSLVLGKPEVRLKIDRDRAADLGVRVSDVTDTVRLFVAGLKAGTYAEGEEEYDIQVRGEARWRTDRDALSMIDVPSNRYGRVPLASIGAFEEARGPAVIDRLGRRRQVTISANAAPGYGDSAVMEAIEAIVATEGLPDGGRLEPIGKTKEQGRAASGFVMVFVLAFVFMYLVLAAQFESWIHPLTILITLPLTVPFALLSLMLFGQSLNLFSGLGLLVLFGVVKKNAILQVDQTNQLRARGMALLDAILEANRERLRPILMTTLAFVAGMVPLMLSKGIGAEKNQATAGIVLGGQTLSLALTLLAAPVLYSLLDDLRRWSPRSREISLEDRGRRELKALLGGPAAGIDLPV